MAFARAVNTMGLSLAMTFLGIYVVESRGYPAWLLGLVLLVANLAQSLSNAWAGNLSDRIGRRPLITGSLLIRSVFIAALGTQIMFDAPLWSLAVNMVITSGLRGCFEPVAYALVSDVVTPEQRISAFGLQRMGTNLGWAVGPALGGTLTLIIPYGAVFYVAAAGMIVAAVVTMYVEDPARTRTDHASDLRGALVSSWRSPPMRILLIATFLAALLQTQMYSTFSIYMTDELGLLKSDVGLLYMVNGIGVLALQIPAVALVRRFGLATVLPWSSLINGLGFAVVGFASGTAGGAVSMMAITVGEVLFAPAHQTAVAVVADPIQRGRAYGVVGFSQMLGIAIAPLIGGVLLDAIGHHHVAMWSVIACIGIAQSVCFAAFVRKV
ncbi:MAG TPA: MFS transporter [Kofleriaceae bacterium]